MGMSRFPSGVRCERARAWAALAPDGELSELERRLLDSHLERCAPCAGFAAQVATVAVELRAAAPEPLRRPVAIPSWRRPAYARLRAVGAAAAVAVMALGITARAQLGTEDRSAVQTPRVIDFSGGDEMELEQLQSSRLVALVSKGPHDRPGRQLNTQPA